MALKIKQQNIVRYETPLKLKFIGGRIAGLQLNDHGNFVAIQQNVYMLPNGIELIRYQYERDNLLLVGDLRW